MSGVETPDDPDVPYPYTYTAETCPGRPCAEGCDHRGVPPGASAATNPSRQETGGRFVILTGNPGDGFQALGPFTTIDELNDWADTASRLRHAEWWALPLEAPA